MREYQPLSEFLLAWRWTSEKHNALPDEDLRRIRPLSPRSAREIAPRAHAICTAKGGETFSADDESAVVGSRLAALPIADDADLLVSFDDELAVETNWGVFRRYWDDFCYPVSYNVAIWSPSEAWTLCYHHSETFTFNPGAQ